MNVRFTQEQLARITALEQERRLTPATLVTDARDPQSPLHTLFEWDNERAAEEYRLNQAREVIRAVEYRIVRNDVLITAPRYISDPSIPGNHPGYVNIESLAQDDAMAVLAVQTELNRALGVLKRAERIAVVLDQGPQLASVVVAVTQIRDSLAVGEAVAGAA
jgi:hypothetical protein